MDHPYNSAPQQAFWKRAVSSNFDVAVISGLKLFLLNDDIVASAGSCFAANIVPFIERAGFQYIRRGQLPLVFGSLRDDNFSYSKFSAPYGNVYTIRQALQIVKRALKQFSPVEDRWILPNGDVIDPYRPGLRFSACSEAEFDILTDQYLRSVIEVMQKSTVFIFTLGLTEAWLSKIDGAVFPACPGTVAGQFDPLQHVFHNFSVKEVSADLDEFIRTVRSINAAMRFIFTVSPVPLVATASGQHVLLATTYSKSVLRVAAEEVARMHPNVTYFPAYEIVTGPQAPIEFFEADRREPSAQAIRAVMRAFLANCETEYKLTIDDSVDDFRSERVAPLVNHAQRLSTAIVDAFCEEAASDL